MHPLSAFVNAQRVSVLGKCAAFLSTCSALPVVVKFQNENTRESFGVALSCPAEERLNTHLLVATVLLIINGAGDTNLMGVPQRWASWAATSKGRRVGGNRNTRTHMENQSN